MIDIALSVLFYTGVAILYRLSGRNDRHFLAVNLTVFLGGMIAALVLGALIRGLAWDRATVTFGVLAGLASVAANLAFLLAVRSGRLAVSWTIFSLALIVPVVLAVVIWHETFTIRRLAGLLATVAALILLGKDMAIRAGETKQVIPIKE